MNSGDESKEHILFVDDEENFLQGLRLMLRGERKDWKMSFVNSADEAMEFVAGNHVDVLVSDVRMPGKTGLDLLTELQAGESTAEIPVIILTGNAEVDLKRRALDLGATDLLNKPVNAEDLKARLRSVLRLRHYQDQLKAQNEILEERVRERTNELERSRLDILWRLAKAGEYRDQETGDHVVRVAWTSRLIADALGLSEQSVESIFMCSPLHDIGKIGVPDGILLKAGELTSHERTIMEVHCLIGAAILRDQPKGLDRILRDTGQAKIIQEEGVLTDPLREMAVAIAESHHEHWDGSGYPNKLAGENIPIEGRIVACADVYDALRSERPYKNPFSVDESLKVMRAESGSHFDPEILSAFESVIDECERVREEYQ